MSQAYTRKNDRDNAVKSLEKAVELNPDDQQLKRRLQQLKGRRGQRSAS